MIGRIRFTVLLSYFSIASVSAALITPALPEINTAYHLQVGQVEALMSVFLFGYVIGQLLYGPLANRWGRLKALRIGLMINIFGLLFCFAGLLFYDYSLLLFGRFISALGTASGLSCTLMLINEYLPEEQRKKALAYSILSFTLGIGIAVSLGGWVTEYWSWQACFLVLFVQGIVMLWGTCLFEETLKIAKSIKVLNIIQQYKRVLKSSTLIVYALVIGFCSSIAYCFSAAAPQITNSWLHLSAVEYGYWNFINMAGMLGGGLWAKLLMQRIDAKHLIYLGFAGCAIGIISLLLMWQTQCISSLLFFVSTGILYLFSSFLFVGGSFIAPSQVEDKASASAMMSFINMGSAMLAVIIMGYLSSNQWLSFISILIGGWSLTAVTLIVHERCGVK